MFLTTSAVEVLAACAASFQIAHHDVSLVAVLFVRLVTTAGHAHLSNLLR